MSQSWKVKDMSTSDMAWRTRYRKEAPRAKERYFRRKEADLSFQTKR